MTATSLRESNRILNLQEYRSGAIELKSRPRFLVIELTQTCNLRCPMCREDQSLTAGRTMKGELFERVAQELFPFAEMVDLRGWGESLILPDIVSRIEMTASFGVAIRFITNLSYRRQDVLKVLAAHRCHVGISMDAADPSLFRFLRGGARFDVFTSNIDLLVNEYQKQIGSTDRLYITTAVQEPALEDLPNIVDFAADHGIKEIRIFSVTADNTSPLQIDGHRKRVDLAVNKMTDRAMQRGIRLVAGTQMGSMKENSADIPVCLHPWAYVYVAYNGSVGFCDHLIGIPGEPFHVGHLDLASFGEIWNGPAWQALRQEHLAGRNPNAPLFRECAWCYKKRYIDSEHHFDPQAESRIVFLSKPGTIN